jgi:hypothetical protein
MFENRMLRRIFGLKRDEVTGGWRKLKSTYISFWLLLKFVLFTINPGSIKGTNIMFLNIIILSLFISLFRDKEIGTSSINWA